GDMPMEAQTRLLRVLQEGEYTRVGGRQPLRANVRIVAATHRDLRLAIRQGLFREDLFYRLNVVPLRVPPLRHRREDIAELVAHFLSVARREGLGAKTIDSEAMRRLRAYSWPGNVRELENLIRRIAALYPQDTVGIDIVEAELAEIAEEASDELPARTERAESLAEAVDIHLRRHFALEGDSLPEAGLYERIVREVERPLIEHCLAATNGNQIRSAEILGLNRNTLRKKIRYLEIPVVRGLR
ncbi:MAG: sigma 54-interacting transcriptional regulator, partial [Alphaproteobacteria bacterium]|nr:sigma 54-interacting transcriptional regulator [Alphaproteobacteria bacterium]